MIKMINLGKFLKGNSEEFNKKGLFVERRVCYFNKWWERQRDIDKDYIKKNDLKQTPEWIDKQKWYTAFLKKSDTEKQKLAEEEFWVSKETYENLEKTYSYEFAADDIRTDYNALFKSIITHRRGSQKIEWLLKRISHEEYNNNYEVINEQYKDDINLESFKETYSILKEKAWNQTVQSYIKNNKWNALTVFKANWYDAENWFNSSDENLAILDAITNSTNYEKDYNNNYENFKKIIFDFDLDEDIDNEVIDWVSEAQIVNLIYSTTRFESFINNIGYKDKFYSDYESDPIAAKYKMHEKMMDILNIPVNAEVLWMNNWVKQFTEKYLKVEDEIIAKIKNSNKNFTTDSIEEKIWSQLSPEEKRKISKEDVGELAEAQYSQFLGVILQNVREWKVKINWISISGWVSTWAGVSLNIASLTQWWLDNLWVSVWQSGISLWVSKGIKQSFWNLDLWVTALWSPLWVSLSYWASYAITEDIRSLFPKKRPWVWVNLSWAVWTNFIWWWLSDLSLDTYAWVERTMQDNAQVVSNIFDKIVKWEDLSNNEVYDVFKWRWIEESDLTSEEKTAIVKKYNEIKETFENILPSNPSNLQKARLAYKFRNSILTNYANQLHKKAEWVKLSSISLFSAMPIIWLVAWFEVNYHTLEARRDIISDAVAESMTWEKKFSIEDMQKKGIKMKIVKNMHFAEEGYDNTSPRISWTFLKIEWKDWPISANPWLDVKKIISEWSTYLSFNPKNPPVFVGRWDASWTSYFIRFWEWSEKNTNNKLTRNVESIWAITTSQRLNQLANKNDETSAENTEIINSAIKIWELIKNSINWNNWITWLEDMFKDQGLDEAWNELKRRIGDVKGYTGKKLGKTDNNALNWSIYNKWWRWRWKQVLWEIRNKINKVSTDAEKLWVLKGLFPDVNVTNNEKIELSEKQHSNKDIKEAIENTHDVRKLIDNYVDWTLNNKRWMQDFKDEFNKFANQKDWAKTLPEMWKIFKENMLAMNDNWKWNGKNKKKWLSIIIYNKKGQNALNKIREKIHWITKPHEKYEILKSIYSDTMEPKNLKRDFKDWVETISMGSWKALYSIDTSRRNKFNDIIQEKIGYNVSDISKKWWNKFWKNTKKTVVSYDTTWSMIWFPVSASWWVEDLTPMMWGLPIANWVDSLIIVNNQNAKNALIDKLPNTHVLKIMKWLGLNINNISITDFKKALKSWEMTDNSWHIAELNSKLFFWKWWECLNDAFFLKNISLEYNSQELVFGNENSQESMIPNNKTFSVAAIWTMDTSKPEPVIIKKPKPGANSEAGEEPENWWAWTLPEAVVEWANLTTPEMVALWNLTEPQTITLSDPTVPITNQVDVWTIAVAQPIPVSVELPITPPYPEPISQMWGVGNVPSTQAISQK